MAMSAHVRDVGAARDGIGTAGPPVDREHLIRFLVDQITAELELADGAIPTDIRDACFHCADADHQGLAQFNAGLADDWWPPTRPPASGHYPVTADGPDTRLITEYATRTEAVLAIEREVERLQAAGATIEGDLSSGYVARWREHGQPVRLHLTLAPVS